MLTKKRAIIKGCSSGVNFNKKKYAEAWRADGWANDDPRGSLLVVGSGTHIKKGGRKQ